MLLLCVTHILNTDGVTASLLPTCWTRECLRSALDCIYLQDYLKSKVAITNKTVFFWWVFEAYFDFSPPLWQWKPSPGSTWARKCCSSRLVLQSWFRQRVIFLHSSSPDPLFFIFVPCWLLLDWLASWRCRSLSGSFEAVVFVHMDTGNFSSRVA